jgi:hypothetical protein
VASINYHTKILVTSSQQHDAFACFWHSQVFLSDVHDDIQTYQMSQAFSYFQRHFFTYWPQFIFSHIPLCSVKTLDEGVDNE